MTLSRSLRWALLATVAATVFLAMQPDGESSAPTRGAGAGSARDAKQGQRGDSEPDASAARRAPTTASATSVSPISVARVAWPPAAAAERARDWPSLNATALAAWQPPLPPPPPPPPAQIAAAPAPVAQAPPPVPVFPYTLIGRVEEGGQVQVLLSSPLRTISARVNELVDGQWRLESIQPGGVVFVWVASGQRQTVNYRAS